MPNLDPEDWTDFSADCHRALDEMIAFLNTYRDRKVWQPIPEHVRQKFQAPLPHAARGLGEVLDDFGRYIRPYATGNGHPLFMGWAHGAGTPVGMLAEMLAAGLNVNCGGRNHIGLVVERQIARWAAELFGFPDSSSGLFLTGTSAANHVAVLVARNVALGDQVRRKGLRGSGPQLAAYTSVEAHACVTGACEMAGMGSDFLRLIPVSDGGKMRMDRLAKAVRADREMGLRPFMVVATAGSVNTGAFDDLEAIGAFCRDENLWLHIDGAFGALCALAPALRHSITGIEQAHSIAFDFHKWAHIPYDAGFLLVRDAEAQLRTFANPAAYLARTAHGLAAGDTWPCDFGPDLSRSFRALKTWFAFQILGADKIGACIEHTCQIARYLAALIERSEMFELYAPVRLNIVCFGFKSPADPELNSKLVTELHESGVAAPSLTTLNGKLAVRAAIFNHRTTEEDMKFFCQALSDCGRRVLPNLRPYEGSRVGAACDPARSAAGNS